MDEGFITTAYPKVQENLKLIVDEQMILEEPVSSTGTLSSLHHLTKDFSYGDQFIDDKPSKANYEKTTADTEAESMVSVTIQQDTSVIPPMTSPVIGPMPRPASPSVYWPLPTTTTTTSATTTTTLPLPPQPQQGPLDPIIIKRMGELEELIANLVEENQALEEQTKKKSKQDSLKTPPGSPPSPPPPPPLPSGASGASGTIGASNSTQAPPPPPPSSSTYQGGQSTSHAGPSSQETCLQLDTCFGTMRTPGLSPSIYTIPDDLYMDDENQLQDEQAYSSDRPASPEPVWTIPSSDSPVPTNNWASTLKDYDVHHQELITYSDGDIATFMDSVLWKNCHKLLTDKGMMHSTVQCSSTSTWVVKPATRYLIRSGLKRESASFDIAATYGISHWWFQRQRFYIDRFSSEGDRRAVRTHMRILTRIESYPNELNLTKPQWAAPDLSSSMDYIVIGILQGQLHSDDRYGRVLQMIMRFNEIHKFSDGTLQQIDEALDYRVKEFRINRTNPGMNARFWTKKDVDRSKDFMFAIQKRLKTRRIFRNLESFVGGRIREGDYRSVLTDPKDQAKMEMETPHSSGVNSPPNAHT
ncbi:hypothetical protein Tco_0088910 [Tanacetum coccineum]